MSLRIGTRIQCLITFFITIFILLTLIACQSVKPVWQINNPYSSVDWNNYARYKANLHTHTIMGGAEEKPGVIIDIYHNLDYSVLALTDHDDNGSAQTTWHWTAFGANPEQLDMVAIRGNEISEVHHIGSYYNDYGNPNVESEEEALSEIGRRDGLAVFHHPGRYNKEVGWYAEMYSRFDHLIGQEVFNKNNRYPYDRAKWDSVLTALMPARPVWGMASDDMHDPNSDIGYSWMLLLLPELNDSTVRIALTDGVSFFINSPQGPNNSPMPHVSSILVDEPDGEITLFTARHDSVLWISAGKTIQHGNTADLSLLPSTSNYIRAEVFYSGNVICTQPFGLIQNIDHE